MLFKDFVKLLKSNVDKFEAEFETEYPDMVGMDIGVGGWEEQFHFWLELKGDVASEN